MKDVRLTRAIKSFEESLQLERDADRKRNEIKRYVAVIPKEHFAEYMRETQSLSREDEAIRKEYNY